MLTLVVQANYNRLLDVARETYKENVGDIFALSRDLSEQHNLPISLVYQETGFIFVLKRNDLDGELPRGLINVTMQKGRWQFSSVELVGHGSVAYRRDVVRTSCRIAEETECKDERCAGRESYP